VKRGKMSKEGKRISIFIFTIGMIIALIIGVIIGYFIAPSAPAAITTVTEKVTIITTATSIVTATPTTPIKGKVIVWYDVLPEMEKLFKEIVETDFKKLYPGIEVELLDTPDLWTKITAAIPVGEGPDLFMWAHDWTGRLVEAGFIVPIDEFITPDLKEKFVESAWEACSYGGKVWALPDAAETVCLIYNKKMIEEAKVNLPKDTDELEEIMKKFIEKGYYGISYPWDPYHVSAYVHAFGGYYFNDVTKKVGVNDPKTIQGLRFTFEKFKPYMPPEPTWEVQKGAFLEGRAPFMVTGPWLVGDIKAAGIEPGFLLLPEVPGVGVPKPYTGVKLTWMSSNVRNKEAAFIFMKWWATNVKLAVERAKRFSWIPVLKEALEHEDVKKDPIVSLFAKQVALGTPMPSSPEMMHVWGPISDAQQAVWAGAKTLEDALNEAQAKIEEEIAKMKG
jgi:arabinogalactan oligomer/maltooligosaccharide transport system substrate-binding protein